MAASGHATHRRGARGLILLVAGLLSLTPATGRVRADDRPLWLVVTRPMFVEAIAPLVEYRRADGFDTVVSTESVEKAISSAPRRPAFVLLVGDDAEGRQDEPWYLPARRMPTYRWRSTQPETFASDAVYGDLTGDGVPDVPVGRFPARTVEQAALAAGKIIAYERRAARMSDLRFPLWAGSPNYSPIVDAAATALLVRMIPAATPPWVQPWIISASRSHPLCGYPPEQARLFTEQLRQGGGMAALVGHGSFDSFFSMSHASGVIHYSARTAGGALAAGEPAPPLLIIACYCGDFTYKEPCLAESLLRMPGGPAAVVAATGESHPLPNYYTGISLVQRMSEGHKRLGGLWLASQRQALGMQNALLDRLLRNIESDRDEPVDVLMLQRDQLLLYALLGDPATRLRLPGKLDAAAALRDGAWQWTASKPRGATELHVELRPARLVMPPAGEQLVPEEARRRQQAANAVYAFDPIATIPADRAWAGRIDRPGRLRLTALAGRDLYTATFDLTVSDHEDHEGHKGH